MTTNDKNSYRYDLSLENINSSLHEDALEEGIHIFYESLSNKYNKSTLNKVELGKELGISVSTINQNILKGKNLPSYIKNGDAKNSKVTFNILDVAKYICNTQKIYK